MHWLLQEEQEEEGTTDVSEDLGEEELDAPVSEKTIRRNCCQC